MIQPGEHRRYVPGQYALAPWGECLVLVLSRHPYGLYLAEEPSGETEYCSEDELLDPNDARGWPALTSPADALPLLSPPE